MGRIRRFPMRGYMTIDEIRDLAAQKDIMAKEFLIRTGW
jgi:predicted NBD/HSP70 family sugar kinase